MKNATFYLINQHAIKNGLNAVEQLACDLATDKWRREGKRVLVACEDNVQALRIDEALWVRNPDAFVPHNLVGEGPSYGAPIELCWLQHYGNKSRDLLISLLPFCANFICAFHEVIDFVPDEIALKQLARDRYKAYRSVGFQLIIAKPPTQ